ncbi:MAG: Rab family GTPase [Anaerolineae bacterium]
MLSDIGGLVGEECPGVHPDSPHLRTLSTKVCLLGSFAVGKTSLVRRFVFDRFDEQYTHTVGVQVNRKTLIVPQNEEFVELTMLLWDMAGNGELPFDHIGYLGGASAAILVCDCTRPYTLDMVEKQAEELLSINAGARLVLAVTKRDLINQRELKLTRVETAADRLNAPFFFVSSKTGIDVDALFRRLGRLIVE